jgi:O-antigen/teichoic acid export membrane protein
VIGGVTSWFCALLWPTVSGLGAAAGALVGMSQSLIFCLLIGKRWVKKPRGLGESLLFPVLASFVVGGCLYSVSHWAVGWVSLLGLGGVGAALILLSGLVEYSEGRLRWLGLRK